MKLLSILAVAALTFSIGWALPQSPQPSPTKASPAATPKADTIDPLVPTAEESALMQPVIAEFEAANKRLAEAQADLLKTVAETDAQVEKLKLELAAKDARAALQRLTAARGQFAEWVATLKKRANCAECLFDERAWKLARPELKK